MLTPRYPGQTASLVLRLSNPMDEDMHVQLSTQQPPSSGASASVTAVPGNTADVCTISTAAAHASPVGDQGEAAGIDAAAGSVGGPWENLVLMT